MEDAFDADILESRGRVLGLAAAAAEDEAAVGSLEAEFAGWRLTEAAALGRKGGQVKAQQAEPAAALPAG
eukprot:316703-Alexandrium_andersonii.AAC.1